MDVFELGWVSDPQISPGGKQIVYLRNGMDKMNDGHQRKNLDKKMFNLKWSQKWYRN